MMAEDLETQTVLILDEAKQPYRISDGHPISKLENVREVLVKTEIIGLNPIDWKAP